MNEFHKDLLDEITGSWSVQQLELYISSMEQRAFDLHDWIKHLKSIRKRKTRKPVFDTGARDGR